MKVVEPIRDKDKISEIENKLKIKNYRDYILFKIGINTGLRISDLLQLKVKDVKNKTHLELYEGKTNKYKKQALSPELRQNITDYIEGGELTDEEYLFQSRKGDNKPIGRVQAYRVLRDIGEEVGLDKIGTHTLRKTFGYHHYKQNKDVALLQDLFNHSSPSITLKYIGINQDIKDASTVSFYL